MQPYFRSLGFLCPQRKDEADFVVEVTTDQGKLYVAPGSEEEVLIFLIHGHLRVTANVDLAATCAARFWHLSFSQLTASPLHE